MTDSKECKIIDTINIKIPRDIIQTPCGKFLIGIEGHSIFRYCLETKQKVRIAGSVEQSGHQDGTRDESRFNYPTDLTLSKDLKTLFISDGWNRVIRAICIGTGITTTFAGPKVKVYFTYQKVLKFLPDGNTLYVADFYNLRKICIATGQVDTIGTFENDIRGFSLSPDSKHVIICLWTKILKYNLETGKSEIIFKGSDFVGCELSKDGQLLFILNKRNKYIKVVNLIANEVIGTITTYYKPLKLEKSTNGNQLYVCYPNVVKVLDISKYCTNFKIFIQLQLFKHSFLPRQVIRFN
jgi:DNA-binding beta-propeller fold protein YncE